MASRSDSSTEVDATEPAPELPGCVVYVASGASEDIGRHITLRRGHLIIGKADTCQLRLHDRLLSRRHVELCVTAEGIGVTDLASTNGTRIGGQRVERALLKPGAQLRVGRTVLVLLPLSRGDGLPPSRTERYGDLLGRSFAMRRLFALLERVEASEAPALIRGETGSGKELVARAIHARSTRAAGPFVVLDCASLSPSLAADTFFGHARGAFTDAAEDRSGAFEQADGGTLFIDELGELPLPLQAQLLRAVETGEVKRLGDTRSRRVDVRVVAATHRDLERAVTSGAFREDLFYRLAVLTIDVPPLRERREDVPLLARHFAERHGATSEALPERVLERMTGHHWPGNVRELRNSVARLLALGTDVSPPASASAHLPSAAADLTGPFQDSRERVVDRFEQIYLEALMHRHGGNLSAASRASGLPRHRLRALLKEHGLYAAKDDA